MDSPGVVNRPKHLPGAIALAAVLSLGLPGCGWFDQDQVGHDAAAVEERLDSVESLEPDRPGFRSLTRSKDPYLALRAVTEERSRLPDDLTSETGIVVTLGDGPGDEVLARRISDAAGMRVRLVGAPWRPPVGAEGPAEAAGQLVQSVAGQVGETIAARAGLALPDVGERHSASPLPRNSACEGWLASWADELSGEAGVWAGPLDRLLDAWTECAGYRWQYDGEAGTVEVLRSETRVFGVHALLGSQQYSVTTTTSGTGGEATSGSSSQSISSEMTYSPWEEIAAQAKAAAGSEGTASVSAAAATVTVTGLPRAVERVRAYLEHVNRHVLRPVTLSVHLYSVPCSPGARAGTTTIMPRPAVRSSIGGSIPPGWCSGSPSGRGLRRDTSTMGEASMHGKSGMKDSIVASAKAALATVGAGLLLASCVAHGAGETVPPQGNYTSHDKAFFEDLLRDRVWILGKPKARGYRNVPLAMLFTADGRLFHCIGMSTRSGKLNWLEPVTGPWSVVWGGPGAMLRNENRHRRAGYIPLFYSPETGALRGEYRGGTPEAKSWFNALDGWIQDSLPRSVADGCSDLAAARPAGMRINEKQTAHKLDELRRQDPDAPIRNFPRSQHMAPGRTGLGASGGKPTTTKAEVEAYLEAQNGNIMVGGTKGAGYTYVRSGGREEHWRVQTANTTRMYFDVVRSEDGRMISFGKYDYVFGYPFGYLPTGHRHPAFQLTDEFLARPYPRALPFMGDAYADKRFVFHPEGKFSVVDEAGDLVEGPHFDGTWRWTRGKLEMTVRDDPAGPRSIEWWELASDLDMQPKIWSRLTPNTR